jgi:hypothetical protein
VKAERRFSDELRRGLGWGLVSAIVICLIFVINQGRSLERVDLIKMTSLYRSWDAAGRPHGAGLASFVQTNSPQPGWFVTNVHLQANGIEHDTIFALTNLHGRRSGGILFVSTNGTLIFKEKSGATRVVSP